MSSILTNNGAMVALQTLRSINTSMATTQNEISTGKSVSNARDNAAVWAVSKTMEADVQGFKSISDSLALGRSSIGVARNAAETVTSLLTKMQGQIVAAQEDNVDRAKIQNDVAALRDQIGGVVNAAQFNGLNLVRGSDAVNILSSLDRGSDGSVSTSQIRVNRQDLSTDAAVFGDGDSLDDNFDVAGLDGTDIAATSSGTIALAGTGGAGGGTIDVTIASDLFSDITLTGIAVAGGDAVADAVRAALQAEAGSNETLQALDFTVAGTGTDIVISFGAGFEDISLSFADTNLTAFGATGDTTIASAAATVEFDSAAAINAGDSYRVTIGTTNFDYVAGGSDTFEDVADGLAALINASTGFEARVTEDAGTFTLEVINTTGAAVAFSAAGAEEGEAAGGLFALDAIDVSTEEGAIAALGQIDALIQRAIDAAAAFGSVEMRIDTQSEFVKNLSDALTTGIGSLVDADMEATSARLQALQVQQQ